MPSQAYYRELVTDSGAIQDGHFAFASGMHSSVYVDKRVALSRASHATMHAACIADHFQQRRSVRVQAVVGPELGAATFMADVRMMLWRATGVDLEGVVARKNRNLMGKPLKSFFIGEHERRLVDGKVVLLVEDVLTTGSSAAAAVAAVRESGGSVVAVAALWNRGGVTKEDLGVDELFSVINEELPAYPVESCPLCATHVPIGNLLGRGGMVGI